MTPKNMSDELEAANLEIERLQNELRAARTVLLAWLESIEDLKETTEFLAK